MESVEEFIQNNANLIYSMTHYFKNYQSKEDLYQAGILGVLEAYKRYDPSKGVKFTTYAYPYILGEMKKYVREDQGIKISRDYYSLSFKIEKVRNLLAQKMMHTPTTKEISDFLNLPQETIEAAEKAREMVYSLDEKRKEDSKAVTLADFVYEKPSLDMNDSVWLKGEISNLSPLEQELIQKRYFKDFTQEETAATLGMSQVQVSRKEKKILQKIRQNSAA